MRDRPWMERIVGTPVPSIFMPSSDGAELDIAQLTKDPAILYLYPGDGPFASARRQAVARGRRIAARIGPGGRNPGHASDAAATPTSCAVQRASFREYALDFAALGVKIVGVSSEPHQAQRSIAAAERLPFPLLSDVRCSLADALSLPTLTENDVRRYRRATLICTGGGVIGAVFYPVSPKRSAMQALAWLERSSS